MNQKAIHETVIRDIIDLTTEIKDTDSINLMKKKYQNKNIASSASAYTLVFPVLVDRSIAIENASMAAKAQERNVTSMMQMLFTANVLSNSKDVNDHVKKFHNNLNLSSDLNMDSMMDLMDKYVFESMSDITDNEARKLISEEFKKNDGCYLEDSINEKALLDYNIVPASAYGKTFVTEAKRTIRGQKKSSSKNSSADKDYALHSTNKLGNQADENHKSSTRQHAALGKDIQDGVGRIERSMNTIVGAHAQDQLSRLDQIKNAMHRNAQNNTRLSNAKDMMSIQKNASDINKNMLIDNDVKKANELTPTLMNVNVIIPKDEYSIPITLILGIKCKMYSLDTMDIVDRIVSKSIDKNFLFKFIKSTTKEISFLKDFIFAIDKAKIDAISQSRRGSSSKMWKVLERRALKGRVKRRLAIDNDSMAITTLVVNQTTIDHIKKDYNINLEDSSTITPVMESLNLLCFCIVDDVNEVTKWIYDTGEDVYEYLSFTNLERETGDGGYKKVVNLLSKSMR